MKVMMECHLFSLTSTGSKMLEPQHLQPAMMNEGVFTATLYPDRKPWSAARGSLATAETRHPETAIKNSHAYRAPSIQSMGGQKKFMHLYT